MNMRRKVHASSALTAEAEAGYRAHRSRPSLLTRGRSSARAGHFCSDLFSAADAMFAPIVNRLHVYAVAGAPATRAYMDAMMALPRVAGLERRGFAEPWTIEKYDLL